MPRSNQHLVDAVSLFKRSLSSHALKTDARTRDDILEEIRTKIKETNAFCRKAGRTTASKQFDVGFVMDEVGMLGDVLVRLGTPRGEVIQLVNTIVDDIAESNRLVDEADEAYRAAKKAAKS